MPSAEGHFKDSVLDQVAEKGNVAQFVSFSPECRQRYSRILGHPPNHPFPSLKPAAEALLGASAAHSVNVRSFDPKSAKSREFLYGLTQLELVVIEVQRLASQGLHTIVNETIDVADGGVSGVAFGDVVEFAPEDTPRCVEKPGTVALSRKVALRTFKTIYGIEPDLPSDASLRVEFSIHPLRRGYRSAHTILWEIEAMDRPPERAEPVWPNRFSRFLGDKAFGLLMADAIGLPVPRTQVFARKVAPFSFGRQTATNEVWIRTCPVEQVPGRFTTQRGWRDPFALLSEEDPEGTAIASVLCQEGVDSRYSGALIAQADGSPLVEGVVGLGDDFMVGHRGPNALPAEVVEAVRALFERATRALGPVRFEWAHDGKTAWIVQFHRGKTISVGREIVPGEASRYHEFKVSQGLEALRKLVRSLQGTREGIVLIGRVGITSHFGDVLRKAGIPSRLESAPDPVVNLSTTR